MSKISYVVLLKTFVSIFNLICVIWPWLDPFACGPLMCTKSGRDCRGKLFDIASSVLNKSKVHIAMGLAAGTLTFLIQKKFCILFDQIFVFQSVVIDFMELVKL